MSDPKIISDSQIIVVSDLKKCLNCGNCIAACKRRHNGVSMHVREDSTIIGNNLIPNLCKICTDPICIEACKRGGIVRGDDGHIVITDNCISCGLCAKACPYGAIHIFSIEEQEDSLIDSILSFILPQTPDEAEKNKKDGSKDGSLDISRRVEKASKKRQRKAVVICDGCAGYNNRACVHNCPAGALKAIPVREFISMNKRFISFELKELLKYSLEGAEDKRKNGTG